MKRETKTVYICDFCRKKHKTEEECLICEKKCKAKENIQEVRNFLQTYHDKNTGYEKHCVVCGKLVRKYESNYDGHRNERGRVIFEDNPSVFCDSWYCIDCVPLAESAWKKAQSEAIQKMKEQIDAPIKTLADYVRVLQQRQTEGEENG